MMFAHQAGLGLFRHRSISTFDIFESMMFLKVIVILFPRDPSFVKVLAADPEIGKRNPLGADASIFKVSSSVDFDAMLNSTVASDG